MKGGAVSARYRERRDSFLAAMMAGATVTQACERLNIPYMTYAKWRQREPEFKAAVDVLRSQGMVADPATWSGDFVSFRKSFFGFDTYWHQARIVDAIESASPQSVTMILVPPEFGKTTLLEDYTNFLLGPRDANMRITIVSEGQPHARKLLRRVQGRMADTTRASGYIARFGPFYVAGQEKQGKPWSADFFTVNRADHDERDYSLEARGWRSAVAGTRTDLLLVDDIQSRRSLNLTTAMVETFRQDFLTRPGKDGRTIIVGTRVGRGDFYEALLDAGIVERLVKLPATNADGESLCPQMWPDEALAKKRLQVGEETWWRNYMQAPRLSGTEVFTEKMVEAAKDHRVIGAVNRGVGRICACDPALVGRAGFVTAAYSADSFEVTDALSVGNLATVEAILGHLETLAVKHRYETLVVEGVAFQRALVYDERLAALGRRYGFRIVGHTTGLNKLDEAIGVARMPSSFITGEISIPYGDEATRSVMDHLVEELTTWRPDIKTKHLRQDLVMALWFAWLYWQRVRASMGMSPQGWHRPGLPWAPSSNLLRTAG